MKIAIQGERGSFHDEAASHLFGAKGYKVVPCATFDATIDSVTGGKADVAIMAIENARSGSILYNYSLIRESQLKVIGEHRMKIRQNLMALPGQSIDMIREVWSHPVAISQCMNFLNRYPAMTIVERDDTAASARRIREGELRGVAAIGAGMAASIYNLDILAPGIETYEVNYTRFLLVGKDRINDSSADKASVCFSLPHSPGSLASLLVDLAALDINLTRIQSVPLMNGGPEYMFYLDLEFGPHTDQERMMNVLNKGCNDLRILGIYKKPETEL